MIITTLDKMQLRTENAIKDSHVLIMTTIMKELHEMRLENKNFQSEIRTENNEFRNEIRSEINDFRNEIKAEMKDFRNEVKSEINEFRAEVKSEINEIRMDLKGFETKTENEFTKVRADITVLRGEDKVTGMISIVTFSIVSLGIAIPAVIALIKQII